MKKEAQKLYNKPNEYYYLKLGRSNSLLPYWLELEGKKNPYGCPCVAIYFYNVSIEEYRNIKTKEDLEKLKQRHREIPKNKIDFNQSVKNQIHPFIELDKTKDMAFITIDKGIIYLLKPTSEAEDMPDHMLDQYHKDLEFMKTDLQNKYKWKEKVIEKYIDGIKNSRAKIRKVKILKMCKKNIPHILLTLSTVRYYNSGTFRRINPKENIGIYRAIEKILGVDNILIKKLEFGEVLELLSPHQFETLIFLVLINADIYSPAWRAGSLPEIDISGINYSSDSSIVLGSDPPVDFAPRVEVKFQVKRKRKQRHYEDADYTIAIDSYGKNRRVLTAKWLYSVIQNQKKTKEWLEYSLRWYIDGSEFKSIWNISKNVVKL